jgi:hypothetical protein
MAGPKVFASIVNADGAGRGADDAPLYVALSSGSAADPAHDAADAGSPLKIGGKASAAVPTAVTANDRVNAYFDLEGRLITGADGTVAHDAADAGAPVKIGGKASSSVPSAVTTGDRVNTYHDLNGRMFVTADVAAPIFGALSDGAAAVGTARNPLRVASSGKASGRAVFDGIVPGNNKYMCVIFNGNTTYDVVIQRIYAIHTHIAAATGVIIKQSLLRISAFTTGTAVTPIMDDPETDSLPATISFDHNSSAVSEVANGTIHPGFFVTGEEMILAATGFQLNRANLNDCLVYERRDGMRGLVLSGTTAANKGLAIKNLTNDTEGSVSYVVEFTIEPT